MNVGRYVICEKLNASQREPMRDVFRIYKKWKLEHSNRCEGRIKQF